MPIFEKPPLDTLTPAHERWTPPYLEHGRLEVDDASVKWIGADRTIFRMEYIRRNAAGLGMLVIASDNSSQGFSVQSFGETDRKEVSLSGLYLIAERWSDGEPVEPDVATVE